MTQISTGARLLLAGKTLKGKNRINEAATVWIVVQIYMEPPLFRPDQPGPWLLVEPLTEDAQKRMMCSRWIHGLNDPDFMIVREI